jgi:hypothetical protein
LSSTFSEQYGGQSGDYYLGYLDAFNPRLGWGNADFDIRHRLSMSGIWETPSLQGTGNRFLRGVAGRWLVGTNLNIRSGSPFSIFDCTNFNGTSCPMYIPNTTLPTTGTPVPSADGPDIFNYITLPHTGTGAAAVISNQGDGLGMPVCKGLYHQGCTYTADGRAYPDRNQFVAPGVWNLDMNLQKGFAFSEKGRLQFRAEMYNIFNHSNQYISGLNLDVSSMISPYVQTEKGGPDGYAGTPVDERRNMQLSLRVIF